ncbi:MAG: acetyl-CoA decarbonylase/synthase complex subunit delta, partial [Actinobacteria bacterium]|nr:acetyl-CoA decarbonylase/synthase complex subunit delta [Actinomycetota bacterium]MCG2819943.1 acetyl-CoA decarbonylase/synthase complex subunit delta [Actinomycetes bacterium]
AAEGKNVVLGPAMEDNYKTIGAAALGYKQTVAAKTPIDVNLAKQLNILLSNLGVDTGKIIVDPTTGALGYGLEYTYSVMERLKLAALQQDDTMTQMPLMADVGVESWKAKEAKFPAADEPAWGDENKRGVMWEIITATTLLVAGADIVIMRHPDAIKTVREVIDNLMG